ncbi:lysophospholipid acyltransferase family protein [Weissella tructae]|uniref:PlsC protein n=2 Tax=Weissella TaxID=46255 RepID=A0A075TZG6_9LACO|nr:MULTISPECIES: 1-acyl-sn-glycerol-3-phosphate acyltransferase [Weissella]AIG65700.1 PlsC protein [Weissella tructae]AIM63016.1 PlsC protein [Weissella ceti]AIM64415.1 PlsC protein [Weissella ceti]ELA06847.1 1-acyl-sn-glycerol-3-phosphate acyltransferase [Weissella ceti NC36]QVV90867.1 1-acyl-sn-glycerol-3-phosphate acyltransferase [Weissella tructae]
MFYTVARYVVNVVFWLFNGRYTVTGKENLPQESNYIMVGPHRALWDMIYFALAVWPKRFTFMAKKELFQNPILRWILTNANAFSVDRENPGPSAIKIPVNSLKKTDMSLIMFPSGTRHSQEMKGGAMMIAKMAGVPLVPVVYQGPVKMSEFFNPFKRGQVSVAIGAPVEVDRKMKMTDENVQIIDQELTAAFNGLDASIDPDWTYVDPNPKD